MQRRLLSLLSLLALTTHTAHAEDEDTSRWDSPKNEGPHLYDAHQHTEKHEGVFAAASWLYWTAHQSNLDYVLDGSDGTEFKNCSYDWDHGARLEGGICGEKDAWILRGVWTHIEISGKCRDKATDDDGFIMLNPLHLFMDPVEMPTFEHAEVRLALQQNLADLQIERPAFWSETIIVTPLVGARYWNLEQFNRQRFATDGDDDFEALRCTWSSKLNGWGIHAGARSEWHMGANFSLLGELGGSLLAANSRDYMRLRSEGDLSLADNFRDQRQKKWRAVPGINLGTGIQWEQRCAEHVYLTVKAVYELHQWFNLSRMRRFAAVTTPAESDFEWQEEGSDTATVNWIATGYVDGDLILFHGGGVTVDLHF